MWAHKEAVESAISRLSAKARSSGIHLILSTQRPSSDVITGQIKINILSRIALSVPSKTDSRVVLDESGAESLLGCGDMLFKSNDRICERLHAPNVDECVVQQIISKLKQQYPDTLQSGVITEASAHMRADITDAYFEQAVKYVKDTRKASVSSLQRQFKIGYQRAANMIEVMEKQGIIAKRDRFNGSREVLAA